MNSTRLGKKDSALVSKSVVLVVLMVLSVVAPVGIISPVSAHKDPNNVVWPMDGQNDTGWMRLDATGADQALGTQATADWSVEFAPGAVLENATLQIRVDGAQGLEIEEPLLVASDVGLNLFDWRGNGMLGSTGAFDAGKTVSGRLSPNSFTGATWTLPSGSQINELVVEALAPSDPVVSLSPLTAYVGGEATHPDDGRLYVGIDQTLAMLDANSNPEIIDLHDFETEGSVYDVEVDQSRDSVYVVMSNGDLFTVSLSNSTVKQGPTSDLGVEGDYLTEVLVSSSNDLYGAGVYGLYLWDDSSSSWNQLIDSSLDSDWGSGIVPDMTELNGILYVSVYGVGVARFDVNTQSTLSMLSTANNLHSDLVYRFHYSSNHLFFASLDAGVARYDYNNGFWLATWNSGNWLASDYVVSIDHVGDSLFILADSTLHIYNLTSGVFTTNSPISNYGLLQGGYNLIAWNSNGARSPSNDIMLLSDGSGVMVELDPSASTLKTGELIIGSGPSSAEMLDVVQVGNTVYVASSTILDMFDTSTSRWFAAVPFSNQITKIVSDGNSIFIAVETEGIYELDLTGSTINQWTTSDGLLTNDIAHIAVSSDNIAIVHEQGSVSIINSSSNSVFKTMDSSSGLDTSNLGTIALWNDIAHIATEDSGVLRYDINNDSFLSPWISTGVNGVSYAPIAVLGDVVHLGLPGYGVARKDMSTGDILDPLTQRRGGASGTAVLPSANVYSLESAGSKILIGTQQGAISWDGSSSTDFSVGSSWTTRPSQHFDFEIDGSDLYSATNIGVCKYTLSNVQVDDCLNVYDGMPNWATYSVGVNSTNVFGGTLSGVGIIDKSSFTVTDEWTAGSVTNNAPITIIDDIAYIGLNGIGIARYEISTKSWLPTWTEYSSSPSGNAILDPGNGDVTSLVADYGRVASSGSNPANPEQIWIGGEDGFQLIDAVNGDELYDIEKSDSLYVGNGNPFDMVIYGDTLYYHQGQSSDNVFRIDVGNFSGLSALDAGQQIGENGGDIYGIDVVGDMLMIGVASGQWWDTDGSGGIAQWNLSTNSWELNIEPIGAVNRVTAYETSTGTTFISWGEEKLQYYSASGAMIGEWTDSTAYSLEFPIREIIEYDGEVLFAAVDGVHRFDESSGGWLSTWTPGSGLPSNIGEATFELWTDGTDLVVGSADLDNFGQFRDGFISHLDSQGNWNTYDTGSNGIPDGYPISMTECGGILNIAVYPRFSNGGVARIDLSTGNIGTSFTSGVLDDDAPGSVTCDQNDILYVGYNSDNEPISRYSYSTSSWLADIDYNNNRIPSDRIWWDTLEYGNGNLLVGHAIGTSGQNIVGGGLSIIPITGGAAGTANVVNTGSAITSLQATATKWLIGQAGYGSGYSHVDYLDQNGINPEFILPGLVSGLITEIAGNSTHVWAATTSRSFQSNGVQTSSGILQGTRLANNSVEWTNGWSLPVPTEVRSMDLIANTLYLATSNAGLMTLDLTSGSFAVVPNSIHGFMDGTIIVGDEIFIGLQGTSASSAGIHAYNLTSGIFTHGKLLAGLPSNTINAFETTGGITYIATNVGIGRYDESSAEWLNPISTANGLPSQIVEDLLLDPADSNLIWIATPAGLGMYNISSNTVTQTLTQQNSGMVGNSVWALTSTVDLNGASTIFAAHDGAGSERPGISEVDSASTTVVDTHKFDQLPSNYVTALTADWWGVHVATDNGPVTHWNSASGDFEDGIANWQSGSWPIIEMYSDGDDLVAMGENGVTILEARMAGHPVQKAIALPDTTGIFLGSDYLWITTATDGLYGYETSTSWPMLDRTFNRRAQPLNVGFNQIITNITEFTHPGTQIQLADLSNTVALDQDLGVAGVHGIKFQAVPLTFSSSSSGSAIWTKTVLLNYNVTLDLSEDVTFLSSLQSAVDNAVIFNGSSFANFKLYSPSNGSMEVRLIYDWSRTETPVDGVSLYDRPNDGGKTLTANWTTVHDEDFARYLVFAKQGGWVSAPTSTDLIGLNPDAAIAIHSRTQTDITSAQGQPLTDGLEYQAVVVVEYNDGRLGVPSQPFGPATPTDEVPQPPVWATAIPDASGQDGDLAIEWERCDAYDLSSTRIYASTSLITDANGLLADFDIDISQGNSSIISLTAGSPYWLAFTCVDEAGQEDKANATIIGPIVPTGGINDGDAPPALEDVWAIDTPDDDGGRVTIGWTPSSAPDCAFVTIWMRPVLNSEDAAGEPPVLNAEDFFEAGVVENCEDNSTIVSKYNQIPLVDGQQYWIAAVASDNWLNSDPASATVLSVTPWANSVIGTAPDRLDDVYAWDHPNDEGTAIDVQFPTSDANDFEFYTIWVLDEQIDDLGPLFDITGTDSTSCGCLVISNQFIDEENSPYQLVITSALYGLSSLESGEVDLEVRGISPDTELFVYITVHDNKGNVHLDDLNFASVTPINNLIDDQAPDRMDGLALYDRPNDDGTGLLLEFLPSTSSDVSKYEIYATDYEFDSVGIGSSGPSNPVLTLDRDFDIPVLISSLSDGTQVLPEQKIWVAVTVTDQSGNVFTTELNVVDSITVDDGVEDPGEYLLEIQDVSADWFEENGILVTWTHSVNPAVREYRIYISNNEFQNVDNAILAGSTSASASFLISNDNFPVLANNSDWYVAVTPVDDEFEKKGVSTVLVESLVELGGTDNGESGDGFDFESLITTPNLIIAGLALAVVFLFLMVTRSLGGRKRNKESKTWQIQEATWGIQDDPFGGYASSAPPVPAPPQTPAPAQDFSSVTQSAQNIQQNNPYDREIYQTQNTVLQPVYDQPSQANIGNDVLSGLYGNETKKADSNIDTSFLDDLL